MPVFKVIHKGDIHYPNGGLPKYHDGQAFETVIGYCTRPDKAVYVGGFGVNPAQAALEMELTSRAFGNEGGLQLRHWVLSFQSKEFGRRKKVDHILRQIAWQGAAYYAYRHQIIYAVHQDASNPHIHFVMSATDYTTGGKYSGTKEDYYNYQDYLRRILFPYGMTLTVAADR